MKNLFFKTAMWKGSGTTVERQSTDGQVQRRYSLTPISKRWKALVALLFLFTLAIGQMWAEEVKLVAVGTTATQSSPDFFDNKTYKSADESYSVNLSTNGTSKSQGGSYDSKKDYYYALGSACDMSGTPSNYFKVTATGCKISKIVVRAHSNSTTAGILPAVGFVSGIPGTSAIGTKNGRYVDTIIVDQTSPSYGSVKKFANAGTLTYTFSTNVSEVYFSKQIKAIGLSDATSWSNYPASNAQSTCVYGMDVYVVPTPSSGPIDPTLTYAEGTYYIGATLDLSTLITASNSTGAITYTVKNADGTGASIDGNNFTATAEGTAVITASQAAVENQFNAKTVDFNVGVEEGVAPNKDVTMELPSSYTTEGDYTVYTYALPDSENEHAVKNKGWYAEVPCASVSGKISLVGSAAKDDRFIYLYASAGKAKDPSRRLVMKTTADELNFKSSDIITVGEKYYIVLSTSDDYKSKGTNKLYVLTSSLSGCAAPSCGATVPGDITKGDLTAGEITLTAGGTKEDDDTWYWQSSASGTSTAASGPTKTVDAAGTYYIRSYNTTDDCWSEAKSITLTAADFVAHYAIQYNKGTYGTGSISNGDKTHDVAFTLSSEMFTRNDYLQVGWTKTDGKSREYMMGGSYTTNAAQTFYPAWAEKVTYTAPFSYSAGTPSGWTFANGGYTNTSATAAYVGAFTANGETTVSGKMSNSDDYIAFAKNNGSIATYNFGFVTTVSALNATIAFGSTKDQTGKIEYLASDGETVLKTINVAHSKTDWGSNVVANTDTVANVQYIRVKGTSGAWMVLTAFAVNYGDLTPKYTISFAKGETAAQGTMSELQYKVGAEVAVPSNGFTYADHVFTGWAYTKTTGGETYTPSISNNKFQMPAFDLTLTAQWAEDNGEAKLYRADGTLVDSYETLVLAVAAATQAGDSIVLQHNVDAGAGIMLTKNDNKNIIIDLGGYTYTAKTPGVGSTNTQNQAFHLEKGNTVKLKNGTVTSTGNVILMLVQNYCDLTMENVTLDGSGLPGSHAYVLSNNCGNVEIGDGTVITAKEGHVAFDVCATNYYPEGVTVTVKDGASITGIVEYDVWGTKPATNQATLAIEGGEFDVTWNVEAALAEDAKSNLNVSGGAFTAIVPMDYCADGYIPVTEKNAQDMYEVTPGCKIYLHSNGGNAIEAVFASEGAKYPSVESPVKAGYIFKGWFTDDETFENAYAVNTEISSTADVDLYAKWVAADANHYVYAYNDEFHYDGVTYRNPEGKIDNGNGTSNKAMTTPYTLFSGAAGITSVVMNNGIYDSKTGDIQAVTALIKVNNSETSKLTVTIAENYTATLKIKSSGYSATRSIAVSNATPASGTTTGKAVNDNKMAVSSMGQLTFALAAGSHDLTVSGGTLYIAELDIEATELPTATYVDATSDASGTAPHVTVVTLPTPTAVSGWAFNGWTADVDVKVGDDTKAAGVALNAGTNVTLLENTTFTAQWAEDNGEAKLYHADGTLVGSYATLVEAVAAATAAGDSIVLQHNVDAGAGIMLTKNDHKNIIIDLGGYTYTAKTPGVGSTNTQNQALHFEKGNTVKLKNGTVTSTGNVILMLVQNYCDLTMENVTLDGSGLPGSHAYVLSNNCGNVEIGDGTVITAKEGHVAFDVCATNHYPEGVTVTVKDGASITGIVEYDVWGTKPATNQATLAIEGGEFDVTWNVEAALAEDAKSNLNVSGGAFTAIVPMDYCADGYIPVTEKNAQDMYEVTPGYKVAFMDGEEELAVVGVEQGAKAVAIANPLKLGYDFNAWYAEAGLENVWDFNTVVSADMALYASWTANDACFQFAAKSVTANESITAGAQSQLDNAVGGTVVATSGTFTYTPYGVLIAGGSGSYFTITSNYAMMEGTKIAIQMRAGAESERGLNLRVAGSSDNVYQFKWTPGSDPENQIYSYVYEVPENSPLIGKKVFYLYRNNNVYLQTLKISACAPEQYTVTYVDGEATLGTEEVFENYSPTASKINTKKQGYSFLGWKETAEGEVVDLSNISITEDKTLYASYEAVTCPASGVMFSLAVDKDKITANTYYPTTTPAVGDLDKYATVSGGIAQAVNTNTGSTTKNFEVKADSENPYFKLGGYVSHARILLDCPLAANDTIKLAKNQAMTISFDSLKTKSVNLTSSEAYYVVPATYAGEDTIHLWYNGSGVSFTKVEVIRPVTYAVTFDMQGYGAQVSAQTVAANGYVTEPTVPTATGMTFAGWYEEAAYTNAWNFATYKVTQDTVLYAKWIAKNDATLKSLKYGETAISLQDGVYTYNVTLPALSTAVPALTAEPSNPAADVDIADAAAFDAEGKATSTVLVTAEDGETQETYTVVFSKGAGLAQVDVTGTTEWDWDNAGSTTLTSLTDVLFANIPGITNDATFNSQALVGTFDRMDDPYMQGNKLSFNTTKAGRLTVEFGGTNNKDRVLKVCVGAEETEVVSWSYNSGDHQTKSVIIPAGKVTLKSFQGESANNVRIYYMKFDATPDYTRPVSNNIGTLCVDHNVPVYGATGATYYQIAGHDEYGKLVFDEVNELKAGEPYIFQSTTGRIDLFYGTTVADEPVMVNGMIGTFETFTLPITEENKKSILYIASNKLWNCGDLVDVGLNVVENRCYIDFSQVQPVASSEPAPGRKRVTISGAPTIATGVENAEMTQEGVQKIMIDGQLFILRGEKMYDATGRLVK